MGARTWLRGRWISRTEAAMVREWASSRRCSMCGAALLDSEHALHHFALRGADHVSREWTHFEPEQLIIELVCSHPLCWDCHVAETFRRAHPELVTDRNFSAGP
ncbi:MAG: hypothetical protein AB7Q29_13270 [Vicinamibacterales bacterium]